MTLINIVPYEHFGQPSSAKKAFMNPIHPAVKTRCVDPTRDAATDSDASADVDVVRRGEALNPAQPRSYPFSRAFV